LMCLSATASMPSELERILFIDSVSYAHVGLCHGVHCKSHPLGTLQLCVLIPSMQTEVERWRFFVDHSND
jgi:hypothetical protein